MNILRTLVHTVLLAGSGLVAPAIHAQTPDITRHDLQQHALSTPGREAVQVLVRFAPGATAANHHHPGEEIVFVTEGTLEYRLAGRAPATLEAGEVLFIPYGVNHEVRNVGNGSATELATYIVEIGQPLVVQAKRSGPDVSPTKPSNSMQLRLDYYKASPGAAKAMLALVPGNGRSWPIADIPAPKSLIRGSTPAALDPGFLPGHNTGTRPPPGACGSVRTCRGSARPKRRR